MSRPQPTVSTLQTVSPCPVCHRPLAARLVLDDSRPCITIEKRCEQHGEFTSPLPFSPAFFRVCESSRNPVAKPAGLTLRADAAHAERCKSVMIDITLRCNLRCPFCFSRSAEAPAEDWTAEVILGWLRPLPHRPTVFLSGGEPTLHEQCFEIIAAIKAHGNPVKLLTNGLAIDSLACAERLKRSGVDWVGLQFDGLDDEVYLQTRGQPLLAEKLRALSLLDQVGVKIMLAVFVREVVNLDSMFSTLQWALRHEHVLHVGLVPASAVGRYEPRPSGAALGAERVLAELTRQSRGELSTADFLTTRRPLSWAFRLTRRETFRQATNCFFQCWLLSTGSGASGFVPLPRLVDRRHGLWRRQQALRLLRGLDGLRSWNRGGGANPFLRLVTIEDFAEEATVDLERAAGCNKVYLTRQGFLPMCVYNTWGRRQERARSAPPPAGGAEGGAG